MNSELLKTVFLCELELLTTKIELELLVCLSVFFGTCTIFLHESPSSLT